MYGVDNSTGVYAIRNIVEDTSYIGSAARGFSNRISLHVSRLRKNKHANWMLQRAWNKHGPECLRFEILERCPPSQCISAEQAWMDRLHPEINILPMAGSSLGHKWSTESRVGIKARRPSEEMRQAHKAAVSKLKCPNGKWRLIELWRIMRSNRMICYHVILMALPKINYHRKALLVTRMFNSRFSFRGFA